MSQRRVTLVCYAGLLLSSIWILRGTSAQVFPRAEIIWYDEGDPLQSAPSETRYFRRTFEERYDLAEAEMYISCNDEFVLHINGKEVGRGRNWQQGKVFDVKGLLRRGKNLITVEAINRGGPAGLVAWLVRRTMPGNHYTLLTDASWKCSKEAPQNWHELDFDDSQWAAAKVLGQFGKAGLLPEVTWNEGKSNPGRFQTKPGFTIDVVAEPELTGSIVAMTFDTKGRPVISRENGPVFILEDTNGDGKFDHAKEYTRKVTNCQGILAYDERTYYLVGNGPQADGLYRLKDLDGDDSADQVELIHKFRGKMSEHGPHAIVAGPDGFLYLVMGNMASVTATPDRNSPVEKMYEADVLPRYEDPIGHAAGIKVPGGATWRLDPEGKHFTLESAGFRNHYDVAFNSLGELFTFDSDMEFQEGLPFYHPVRVMHSPPGSDFGWRSNSGKWAPYYVDSLPALVDIGRGSPCGVVFYNHPAFPPEYEDAFFITDWSYGRIFALRFNRDGGTFRAELEEFVTGKPLNVTDIEVSPNGSLYFTTGGRGTEGGVYGIRWVSAAVKSPSAAGSRPSVTNPVVEGRSIPETDAAVQAALNQPQPQSAWGRSAIRGFKAQAGDRWQAILETAASDRAAPARRRIRAMSYLMQFGPEPSLTLARQLARDRDPEVRAQAAVVLARYPSEKVSGDLAALLGDPASIVQRRAAEGLVRTQTAAPVDKLRPLLASKDRFVRFAARLALERIDPGHWRDALLGDKNPRVAVIALVSLNKLGLADEAAFAKELSLLKSKLSREDELDVLRCIELTLVNTRPESRPSSVTEIGKAVLDRFPTRDVPMDRELARIAAVLRVPGAIEKLLAALEKQNTEAFEKRAEAIHYAYCLVSIAEGWTPQQRRRYLAWFEVSKDWKGTSGPSYPGYIAMFLRNTLAQLSEADRLALVREAAKFPYTAARIIEQINNKSDAEFVQALETLLRENSPVLRRDVISALGRTGRSEAEAILGRLYNEDESERDMIVRALANFPNTRIWTMFVSALNSQSKTTVQAALRALSGINQSPEDPAPYRAAIQAANRLGEQGAWQGIELLRQWAGIQFGHEKEHWKAELKNWQTWYAETYPDAPTAQFDEKRPDAKWNYDQLLTFLEDGGRTGSVGVGGEVYKKVACAVCHRLGNIGAALGPDLTALSSRFKRKDTLEAIVYPSRVISDQYKSVAVTMKDGRVFSGMKAPDEGENLVLLLLDATTLKLPKVGVAAIGDSGQSIMPDGLLNQLSLREIADLFAFLESGEATGATAKGQPGR